MLSIFEPIRDFNTLSVIIRMILATLCGGLVGIERAHKRRAAGFRTHILICLGAAMTTLISQYLVLELHQYTDIARLGAQVIAGISFIGAGCIIVTGRRRVKGLTTAAGLWVSAIVGLACGAGYYEGAILATLFILCAELLFSKLEFRLMGSAQDARLLIQYENTPCLNEIIKHIHELDVKILDLDIHKSAEEETSNACAAISLQFPRKIRVVDLTQDLMTIRGVFSIEEL